MAEAQLSPQLFAFMKKMLPNASDADIVKGYQEAAAQNGGVLPDDQTIARSFSAGAAQPAPVQVTAQKITPDQQIAQMPAAPAAPAAPNSLDAMYEGQGPTARRLNAADPARLREAAERELAASGLNNPLVRAINQFSAGTNLSGTKTGALEAERKRQADALAAVGTGLVKSEADIASKGLGDANAALGAQQSAAASAGELDMKKRAFILEQRIKGVNAEQAEADWEMKRDAYDANSSLSKAGRKAAGPLLQKAGMDPKMVDGMSFAQMQMLVGSNAGLQKQWLDQVNVLSGAAQAQAGAAQAYAGAAKTGEETKGVRMGNDILSNVAAGGLPGTNTSINVGPVSITPSPATTGMQAGAAAQNNDLRKQVTNYETSGVGRAIDTVFQTLPSAGLLDTGTFGAQLAKVPGSDAQAIKSSIASVYVSKGMDPQVAAKEAQAVLDATPRQAGLRLAQIKSDQMVGKAVLAAQEEHVKKSGDLSGFSPKQYRTFYNPRTGQVTISDDPKDKAPKGWLPVGK